MSYFNQHISPVLSRYAELVIWISALLCLYFLDAQEEHSSLCIYKWMGLGWCPGCGIGHAMHDAMHFQWGKSISAHPFGIPAVCIILYRIFQLAIKNKNHVLQ